MTFERRETRVSPDPYDRTEVVATTPDPTPSAAAERVQATSYDPYERRRWQVERTIQAIYLVFGVVEGLLVIRFLLRLFGANQQAEFARFIYGITGGLVAPFVGLFGTPQYDGSVLELHTIVAMVIYALVAWLLARVVWLIAGETRSATTTSASSVETRAR